MRVLAASHTVAGHIAASVPVSATGTDVCFSDARACSPVSVRTCQPATESEPEPPNPGGSNLHQAAQNGGPGSRGAEGGRLACDQGGCRIADGRDGGGSE